MPVAASDLAAGQPAGGSDGHSHSAFAQPATNCFKKLVIEPTRQFDGLLRQFGFASSGPGSD
jgi:hypothetical protein